MPALICTRPPPGWFCRRGPDHDGPCAAEPTFGACHGCGKLPDECDCLRKGRMLTKEDVAESWSNSEAADRVFKVRNLEAAKGIDLDYLATSFDLNRPCWSCWIFHIEMPDFFFRRRITAAILKTFAMEKSR